MIELTWRKDPNPTTEVYYASTDYGRFTIGRQANGITTLYFDGEQVGDQLIHPTAVNVLKARATAIHRERLANG